jgi:diguanylate cyclase (GGDEF)-like protein
MTASSESLHPNRFDLTEQDSFLLAERHEQPGSSSETAGSQLLRRTFPGFASACPEQAGANPLALDRLTGLFCRSCAEQLLEYEIARAHTCYLPLSVAVFDVDHFESFREECGRAAAAILLQAVAQMLQSRTRPQDFACRYQGAEFMLAMPEAPVEVVCERAEQFRAKIRTVGWCHNSSLPAPVTLSAGIAAFPEHAGDSAFLLRQARVALRRAIDDGRDRVVIAAQMRTAAVP